MVIARPPGSSSSASQGRPAPAPRHRSAQGLGGFLQGLVLGTERWPGLWFLPLLVGAAVLGGLGAGALVVLYHGQDVADLRAVFQVTENEVQAASERIDTAESEAIAAIDDEMARLRADVTDDRPVLEPAEAGIFGVTASGDQSATSFANGLSVHSGRGETYVIVGAGTVTNDGRLTSERVQVFTNEGARPGEVHNVDLDLGLAVVVVSRAGRPVPDWRPADSPPEPGDPVYLTGFAGPRIPIAIPGQIDAVTSDRLAVTTPTGPTVAGAALLDQRGRVVGLLVHGAGDGMEAVPVRRVCETLLKC